LTPDELTMIERVAHSRTAEARVVERAQLIWHAGQGLSVPAIAGKLGLHEQTVRHWLKRFNARGLEGLHDQPRGGRPATYTPEQVAAVIATALTDPQTLGQPFARWTLDRLAAYLNEAKGIPIKRSRIDDLLIAEGLRWRQQEPWFGDRPDPAFAKTRGHRNPRYRPTGSEYSGLPRRNGAGTC
jgi:transposase